MRTHTLLLVAALAATPLLAQDTRRIQVFSETFSLAARGPYFIRLDSGVTYRIAREGPSSGDISVSPRSAFAAPVRFSSETLQGQGAPFIPVRTGDYRIESSYQGTEVIQVRIFRDVLLSQCASDQNCTLISSDEEPRHHRISPAVWVMMALFPAFIYGVMKNGKNL